MNARTKSKPTAHVEVIVRAVIGHDDRLLLVRQRGTEHWSLPGGHVEPGEPAEIALRREIREELDATVRFTTFLAVVEHGYRDAADVAHHEVNLVFDVTLADPHVRTREDHLHARWVPSDALASIDLRPAGVRAGLQSGLFDRDDRWLPWEPVRVLT